MSISLNAVTKYKTRVLPSVVEFIKRENALPKRLLFSLAALIAFYKGDRYGEKIALKDDKKVLDFFTNLWELYDGGDLKLESLAERVLANVDFWEEDLNEYKGLRLVIIDYLNTILNNGMKVALNNFEQQTTL